MVKQEILFLSEKDLTEKEITKKIITDSKAKKYVENKKVKKQFL